MAFLLSLEKVNHRYRSSRPAFIRAAKYLDILLHEFRHFARRFSMKFGKNSDCIQANNNFAEKQEFFLRAWQDSNLLCRGFDSLARIHYRLMPVYLNWSHQIKELCLFQKRHNAGTDRTSAMVRFIAASGCSSKYSILAKK